MTDGISTRIVSVVIPPSLPSSRSPPKRGGPRFRPIEQPTRRHIVAESLPNQCRTFRPKVTITVVVRWGKRSIPDHRGRGTRPFVTRGRLPCPFVIDGNACWRQRCYRFQEIRMSRISEASLASTATLMRACQDPGSSS